MPAAVLGAAANPADRGWGGSGRMKQIGLWGPPIPPTVRTVTDTLRSLNRLNKQPFTVSLNEKGLVSVEGQAPEFCGIVSTRLRYGRENLPGNSQKFDAVASAKRLLAALRDLEPAG